MGKKKEPRKLKTLPKRITVEFLKELGACHSEITGFEQLFPRGAVVNYANILKALRANLTVYFILEEYVKFFGFVTDKQWASYDRTIHRFDNEKDNLVQMAYTRCEKHKDIRKRTEEVEKIIDRWRVKEAKLSARLWRLAKPKVWVFDEEDGYEEE
jgi:hypothetical protein